MPLGTCDDTVKNVHGKTVLGFGDFDAVRFLRGSNVRYQGHTP